MYPGKRPFRVTIFSPVVTPDDVGNQAATMQEDGQAWASIEALTGREYFAAAQTQSETTHKITLAKPAFEVTPDSQVAYSGRIFEVTGLLDTPGQPELVLMCKEHTDVDTS